jgi:MerR family copper efflux transcriptional regulator
MTFNVRSGIVPGSSAALHSLRMRDERFFIRDIARQAGVSVDTVRHYERKGLLGSVGRDASGYRRYDAAALKRVRIIRRALLLGFTLDELARVFRQRAAGQPPCRSVRALAAQKLGELDERIAAMTTLRDRLTQIVRSWDDELERTPPNAFAHLLDTLA